MIPPSSFEIFSTLIFVAAIIHTFLVSKFRLIAAAKKNNSFTYHIWHLLSEVELVFAFWAFILLFFLTMSQGINTTVEYLGKLNFVEPVFVFVIMCVAATKPIVYLAEKIILILSSLIPLNEKKAFYFSALTIGPMLGALITEPAAMTVTAMILLQTIYKDNISLKFKYATLGLLFVNISIGGTLTNFAAPPVLMVASKWNWTSSYMFMHFGIKSLIAIIISTSLYTFYFRHELKGKVLIAKNKKSEKNPSFGKIIIHLILLILVVVNSHHPIVFVSLFCVLFAFEKLKIKESLMVALFLAGLICLGPMQAWWLNIILAKLSDKLLFFGTALLTSITDNAALTYLGSLVDLSETSKYSLVAGAVAGGGLTVIANAPNPAGFAILGESFGKEGISPLKLFIWALVPTVIALFTLSF